MKHGLNGNSNYKQGTYIPKYPDKYVGSLTQIYYRSSWELRVMKWLDMHPSVISWNSEDFKIRYFYPADNKYHTYHVDFIAKMKLKDGTLKTYAIEIKPLAETKPPSPKTKNKQRLMEQTLTYIKNQAKWEAAKEYCRSHGIEFLVLTEKDIGL